MKNFFIIFILLNFFILLLPAASLAEGSEINTADIIKDTVKGFQKCAHYKVIGMCFWVTYDWKGPHFFSTLKVDYYSPDAIVSVYNHNGANPWLYANKIVDAAAYKAAQVQARSIYHTDIGESSESAVSIHDNNDKFKEVDVIGNPGVKLFDSPGFFIGSRARIFMPYYQSMLDALAWRSPLTETFYPASLVPGMREVGSFPLNVWGNIYPRNGYIDQPTASKAAAVIAMRGIDIATHFKQPHIYHNLYYGSCGHHCQIYETKENDPNTQFQMIYPKAENTAEVFGKNDLGRMSPWRSDAEFKGSGNYAWIMWRRYRGCIQANAHFIGDVTWGDNKRNKT
jgi:integrating conjugative element protein (TIGR03756 family)